MYDWYLVVRDIILILEGLGSRAPPIWPTDLRGVVALWACHTRGAMLKVCIRLGASHLLCAVRGINLVGLSGQRRSFVVS